MGAGIAVVLTLLVRLLCLFGLGESVIGYLLYVGAVSDWLMHGDNGAANWGLVIGISVVANGVFGFLLGVAGDFVVYVWRRSK
jgi:hypothetical protein